MYRIKYCHIIVMLASISIIGLMSSDGLAVTDQQVNISGATLFANFFHAPASTNDWIDVDGDGIWGYDTNRPVVDWVDQLARDNYAGDTCNWWVVQYRGVGSGNGLYELVTWYNTAPDDTIGTPSEDGLINRAEWCSDGTLQIPPAVPSNPGGTPVPPNNIDIAVMDVPTTWFTMAGDVADVSWNLTPASEGYGQNPVRSWNVPDRKNVLKSLGNLNTNIADPDDKTVFDTQIAFVPMAIIANAGVSEDPNYTQQQLQHLFLTGRLPNGENLAAACRDSGSGTRNGTMNTLGVDPSWGRGDNLGDKLKEETETNYTILGPAHQASHLGGSSRMESAVQNRRLAIGYTGLAGSSRAAADSASGKYELANYKKTGAAAYVRPSLDAVLDNSDPDTGWQIGGPETFATVGNPDPCSSTPMLNLHASDYIANIVGSIDDFVTSPSQSDLYNMPGEYLAYNFFLIASVDAVPEATNPSTFETNSDLNQALQDFVRGEHYLDVPGFNSWENGAGQCPSRKAGITYNDGQDGGAGYIDSNDQTVTAGTALSVRNKIMGDFNYAGDEKNQRNVNDIAEMMSAVADWENFEAGNNNGGDGYVIVHVIGDFNGDGDFDEKDIRYFGDGLAIDAGGQMDRKEGFTAIDTAWTGALAALDPCHPIAGNYFNTTLATGNSYKSGDARGDIAGGSDPCSQPSPGARPMGGDYEVGPADIDYLHKVLRYGLCDEAFGMTPGPNCFVHYNELLWTDADDAVWMNLSCDMDGNLEINYDDVHELICVILETDIHDVNLDGAGDNLDRQIIETNINPSLYGRSWSDGDIDGDGYVTDCDLNLFDNSCNIADINHDGIVNLGDLAIMSENWLM